MKLLESSVHAKQLRKNENSMKKEYDLKKLKRRESKPKVSPEAAKVPISLRIDGADLADIRTEAQRLGLPYQTLVSSILHRYV